MLVTKGAYHKTYRNVGDENSKIRHQQIVSNVLIASIRHQHRYRQNKARRLQSLLVTTLSWFL